jgi:DNA modification methylase
VKDKEEWFDLGKCPKCKNPLKYGKSILDRKCPYSELGMNKVICGDCIEVMKGMEACSVDVIVSDPPYGLAFMGKDWDSFNPKEFQKFSHDWGFEAFRILKLGGYVLAFSGTRTYHRMVCGLEDAGFTIKDMMCWMYGSGFPKSLSIPQSIDKHLGFTYTKGEMKVAPDGQLYDKRKKIGHPLTDNCYGEDYVEEIDLYEKLPTSKEAKKWIGYGTSLKPAFEPIVVAQKPYEKTYANNVLKYGVGGLNIDACRIGYQPTGEDPRVYDKSTNISRGKHTETGNVNYAPDGNDMEMFKPNKGRFPSNVLLQHHPECVLIGSKEVKTSTLLKKHEVKHPKYDNFHASPKSPRILTQDWGKDGKEQVEAWDCHPSCPIRLLDEQSGVTVSKKTLLGSGIENIKPSSIYGAYQDIQSIRGHNDKGGASRFFYCGKAHKSERNAMNLEEYPIHYELKAKLSKNDKEDKKLKEQIEQHTPYKILNQTQLKQLPIQYQQYFKECKHIYWRNEDEVSLEEYQQTPKDNRAKDNPVATLKPINVMRYLVRLVCPPNGTVLDPFAGSGTTGVACIIEGFNYLLIEKRERFANLIIPKRLKYWSNPSNWDTLKDHNELPKIKDLVMKKKYKKLNKIKQTKQITF